MAQAGVERTGTADWPVVWWFVLLATSMAWGWWGQLLVRGVAAPDRWVDSHLPALLAPALAAMLLRARMAGIAAVWAFLAGIAKPWRRPGLLIASLGVPVGLAVLVWLATGRPGGLMAYPGVPPGSGVLKTLVPVIVCNGFGEEAGWRGFLLPALAPLGRLRSSLVVGLIWAGWHLPAFLLPFGLGAGVNGPMILGWAASLLAGSVVLAWVWFASGGALGAVMLWHLAFNFATATEAMQGPPAMAASAGVILMAALVVRHWRRAAPA